mgnify:CR=1 FL=1
MKKIQIYCLLLCMLFHIKHAIASTELNWIVRESYSVHTIYIPKEAVSYNGNVLLDIGDLIGAFYDSAGTWRCGGMTTWSDDSVLMYVYGKTQDDDGFEEGEPLKFFVYKKKNDCLIANIHVSVEGSGYTLVFASGSYTVLENITASIPYISYGNNTFCTNDGIIAPLEIHPDYQYYFSSPAGLAIDLHSGIIDLSKTQAGSYQITISGEYCHLNSSVYLYVFAPQKARLGNDTAICHNDSLRLSPGNFAYYQWSTGSTTKYIVVKNADSYWVKVKDNTGCYSSDTILVSTYRPEITIESTQKCTSVLLEANNNHYTYRWSTGDRGPTTEVNNSGTISLQAIDHKGCRTDTSFYIAVQPFDISNLSVGIKHADCNETGMLTIQTSTIKGGTPPYTLEASNTHTGMSYSSHDNSLLLRPGTYELIVRDNNDCEEHYSRSIEIVKSKKCRYPVIAPNGNGLADRYFIDYNGKARIYDRYGKVVKSEFSVPSYWDGTDDAGRPLPMGSYMIVCENDEFINITIIR